MKVLHVIPSIAPRYGGPSQAVMGMCRALRAAGVDAEIATTDADGPGRRLEPLGDNPSLRDEVPVWMFPRDWSERWKYSPTLTRWLMRHVSTYDVIHVHWVFSHSTLAARCAANRAGVPVVLRPCGMLAPYSLSRSRLLKQIYWRVFEGKNVRDAACLHATTPEERDELQQLAPGQPTTCIPVGLDQDVWDAPADPGAFRRRHGIPLDRPLLLFLSRLHQKKGLADLLLPALAELPEDVMLAVVGGDDAHDPDYGDLCRLRTAELGLTSRVFFTGPVYGNSKWSAYDDADLHIFPSRHENFGVTAIEAMARGTPTVFTPGVQAGRFVLEGKAGIQVEPSVPSLTVGIHGLLARNARERDEMGRRGREYSRTHFTWKTIVLKLIDLYRTLPRGGTA